MNVGQLKKMLSEYDDASPIDIWVSCTRQGLLRGPTVEASIQSIDLQVDTVEGPPFLMIVGELIKIDFSDCSDLEGDD